MGIKPDPGSFNNNCPLCFPVNESPELMILFLGGIEKSPHFPLITEPAPNGYCDVLQTGIACEWKGGSDQVWRGVWRQAGNQSVLTAEVSLDVFAFVQSQIPNCDRYFENFRQDPRTFAYNYGYAYVATSAEMQAMIELAMPVVGPDPRMELFPMEDRQIVIRFANIQNGTNIKLRIDVDDL